MPLAYIHWIGDGQLPPWPTPQPPYPDQGLPPFPSHPIVVPPGGAWPQPPTGGGQPPRPWDPQFPTNPIQLPPWAGKPQPPTGGPQPPQLPDGIWGAGGNFPSNPIQLPPWAGGWQPRPDQGLPPFPDHPIVIPKPPTEPTEPVDPNYGIEEGTGILRPSHPINLPPSEHGYWLLVYIPGIGWEWIEFSPSAPKPPSGIAVPKDGDPRQ